MVGKCLGVFVKQVTAGINRTIEVLTADEN